MNFKSVCEIVDGIPHTTRMGGRKLYEFVVAQQPTDILELGFAHGVSTCYLAAALDSIGGGHIITVDLKSARARSPNIEELLARTGLAGYVTIVHEPTSYTWYLKRLIEQQTVDGQCRSMFDFCFIDGAHSWFVDGLAFFLADKLLRPGGWMLFDDLRWSYAASPSWGKLCQDMPEDERTEPHIGKVFELLVRQHSSYRDFKVDDGWGWARKVG